MGRPRDFDDDTVIECAMDAFWTYGYAHTSPARLAEATGIGKGSLYNAFRSKRELFDRALDRYGCLGADAICEYWDRPGTARENIRDYLRYLIDVDVQRERPRGCLVANTAVELSGQDAELERKVRAMVDGSITAFADRIARGQRDGDVDISVDPRACAEFLMNTLSGLRVMTKTHDVPTLHRIIDSALAVL